jgi:PLP dependent protein
MVDPKFETWQQRIHEFRRHIPPSVRIIAVTKTLPSDAIRAAYAAGLRDVGESRVQEALSKQADLTDLTDLTWHLIGRLQSNKVAKALEIFSWIHSVDNLQLAQRIDRLAAENPVLSPRSQPPKLCLQVRLRDDPNKSGWEKTDLFAALPCLDQLHNVQICGLMVIPPFGLPGSETQAIFAEAQALAATIQRQGWQNIQMDQLSMGMSDDYIAAIAHGATMIRPGRGLFGDRPPAAT